MVVDAKRLFGGQLARRRPADDRRLAPTDLGRRVADVQRAEAGVAVELRHQVEAQLAAEQRLVVAHHQRVGQGHARQVPHRPLAADHDVVGLVQPGDDLFALLRAVGVGHRALAAGHFGIVRAIGVAAVQPHRQQVVPMLVDQQACPGANGAARPRFGRQQEGRAGRGRRRRQLDDDRPPLAVQLQRMLDRHPAVEADADRLAVAQRGAGVGRGVEVGVAQVVEAHGANKAVFGQVEAEKERRVLMDELESLQGQVQLACLAAGRVVEQRRPAGHVVVDPL